MSPGAQAMTQFLTIMEQIDLGEHLKRATARKIVDEQLQVVVKVRLVILLLYIITGKIFLDNNFFFPIHKRIVF